MSEPTPAHVIDIGAARARRDEPFVTQGTIAKHYHVTTRTVRAWHDRGLPVEYRFGRPRYKLSVIEAWFKEAAS